MTPHEEIERIKRSGETTHEAMVEAARRMRLYDQRARALEQELAAMPASHPGRETTAFLLSHVRAAAASDRSFIETARRTLSANSILLTALEEYS
jgi:hypothetical protein